MQITDCTFENEGASIEFNNIADINIKGSFFQIKPAFLVNGYITFINAHTVRIINSHFNSSTKPPTQIYFEQKSFLWQTMKLRTLKSSFTSETQKIESSSEDFLKKVEASKMIKVDFAVKMDVLETKYASSE